MTGFFEADLLNKLDDVAIQEEYLQAHSPAHRDLTTPPFVHEAIALAAELVAIAASTPQIASK